MTQPTLVWYPSGSDAIARYAHGRGLAYDPRPALDWFAAWEPHDTMVSPEHWYNACTHHTPFGLVVIAEPWTTGEGLEPLERTLVAFAQVGHGPSRRAAMRVGEPFMTKVAFLEMPPPPMVKLGDKVWDEHVTTFAASASEAIAAFPPKLRELLRARGFQGHLEIRPGGFVLHREGFPPSPEHYDRLFRAAHDIAQALISR